MGLIVGHVRWKKLNSACQKTWYLIHGLFGFDCSKRGRYSESNINPSTADKSLGKTRLLILRPATTCYYYNKIDYKYLKAVTAIDPCLTNISSDSHDGTRRPDRLPRKPRLLEWGPANNTIVEKAGS